VDAARTADYAAVTGLVALATGIFFVVTRGWPAVILLALGAVFVLFYTWPLKYIGLGELAVIIVWGPLMVAGGYFVITGQWDWRVALASMPYALGPTTVIFGKHIDKHDPDKAKGIHTFPVIIGERSARRGKGAVCAAIPAGDLPGRYRFFTPGHAARAAGRGEPAARLARCTASRIRRSGRRASRRKPGRPTSRRRRSITTAVTACFSSWPC
jgi:hypothetical protein